MEPIIILALSAFLGALLFIAFQEEKTEKGKDPHRERFSSRYWKKSKHILFALLIAALVLFSLNFVFDEETYEYTLIEALSNVALVMLFTIFWTTGEKKKQSEPVDADNQITRP